VTIAEFAPRATLAILPEILLVLLAGVLLGLDLLWRPSRRAPRSATCGVAGAVGGKRGGTWDFKRRPSNA